MAALDAETRLFLDEATRRSGPRVERLSAPNGDVYWLKRIEKLSIRLRLQKGDPRRSLDAERQALHVLGDAHLPVPELVTEGRDFLILPDLGPSLQTLLLSGSPDTLSGFTAAGTALAELHQAGFSHGRPALRDMCWDGRALRIIDFERFESGRASSLRRALDLVLFVHSYFQRQPVSGPEIDGFLKTYLAAAPVEVVASARRLMRGVMPLGTLSRGLMRLRASREIQATAAICDYLPARLVV